jgi:hypothetical protein
MTAEITHFDFKLKMTYLYCINTIIFKGLVMKNKVALVTVVLFISMSVSLASRVEYVCPPANSFVLGKYGAYDAGGDLAFYAKDSAVVASKEKINCPINEEEGPCASSNSIETPPASFIGLSFAKEASTNIRNNNAPVINCYYEYSSGGSDTFVKIDINKLRYRACLVVGASASATENNTGEYYDAGGSNLISCSTSNNRASDCAISCREKSVAKLAARTVEDNRKLPQCYFQEQGCITADCREKIELEVASGGTLPQCYFYQKSCITVACRGKIGSIFQDV